MNNPLTRAARSFIKNIVNEVIADRAPIDPQPSPRAATRPAAALAERIEAADHTLTVRQAADLLGLGRETVRLACQEGRVDAIMIDGTWHINAATLENSPLVDITPRKDRRSVTQLALNYSSTDTQDSERTVSPQQAAEFLGLADSTVQNYCRTGRVKAIINDSGHWRIPLSEVTQGELSTIRPRNRKK